MWYKIKQGRHRAYPLSLGIHTGKTSESYEVIFDESCRYELDSENQEDWNKLVGWSYGLHHQNSIRIAWRYNKESDKIQLALYIYENGIRIIKESGNFYDINELIRLELFHSYSHITLMTGNYNANTWINAYKTKLTTKPKWGYNLGCYFGGNMESPKDMKIWIKKI